jgi:hypothetical protein
MTDEAHTLAESHSAEAVNAAANAQEAAERARAAQMKAAVAEGTAELMLTLTKLVIGQDHTNEHLRMLNGKVADHEKALTAIALWRAEAKGYVGAINIGWTTLITIFSGIGGAIIFALYKR